MARFHVSVRHEGKETAAFGPYLTRRSALVDAKILARRLKAADEEADSIQPIKKEHEEIGYKLEASQGLFKFLTVEGASRRKNPHPPLTKRKNTGKTSDAVVSEAARIAKEFGQDAKRRGATSILDISVDGSYHHWLDAYAQTYPLRAADILKVVHKSWREGYRESGDASGPRPLALRKNTGKSPLGYSRLPPQQSLKDALRAHAADKLSGWKLLEYKHRLPDRGAARAYWSNEIDKALAREYLRKGQGTSEEKRRVRADLRMFIEDTPHYKEELKRSAKKNGLERPNPSETKRAVEVFELKSGGYDVVFGHKDKSEFLVSRSKPRKRYKTYKGAHAAVTRWVRTGK